MVAALAAWTLAAVLAGAALLKLRDPAAGQAALATYGLRHGGARRAAWSAVIAIELALAIGMALASAVAAYLAAGLFAGFALALGVALVRGRRGEPGGCLEVGSRTQLLASFDAPASARLALAVFTSEGCPMCRTLEPAVEHFARDPMVALRRFDERRDARAWRVVDVPGSPYAVALGLDGTVLAKGTFNSLGQLESVLATAERREREAAVVEGTSRRGLLARAGEAVLGLAAGRLVAAAVKPRAAPA